MAANQTIEQLRGDCPAPFLDVTHFPNDGGFIQGRFCAPLSDSLTCCLPCPATDWVYPDSFHTWSKISESFNALSVAIVLFLLISYGFLPAEKSRRHYLSVCLVIGIGLLSLGFVVPLAASPKQCFNQITPNDMYSNLTCAWSGAFIISGGLTIAMWIFIRTLSMHLQVCWDVAPGKKFFYAAQGLGWSLISLFFVMTLVFTGVSFRFGDACHVNSEHSMKVFWGPMLGIAAASMLLQLATFVYCIHVYLKNMFSDEKTETTSSGGLPSYTGSLRAQTARGVYRRVRKVVWLQWRAMLLVVFILADVIFLSIVFVYLNDVTDHAFTTKKDQLMTWLICLAASGGEKSTCFGEAQKFLISQPIVTAVLMLLALTGIQTLLLLGRVSMFTGWYALVRNRLVRKSEFVSLDAKRYSDSHTRQYELMKVTSPVSTIMTPTEVYRSHSQRGQDALSASQRQYQTPRMSFSSPRPPSSQSPQSPHKLDWDPRATHARGGLGFHPPIRDEDDEEFDGMSNRI